jgi:hypothetical protein
MARCACLVLAAALVAVPVATGGRGVYALLANRELLRVDATGHVIARARIGDAEPHAGAVGSYLALGPDRGRLFVLSPPGADDAAGQSLAVLDPVTLRRLGSVALPHGLVFHSLQVGRRTGRIHLAGNAGTSASVCVGAPVASPAWRCAVVRRAGRLSWDVLDSALAPDERRLLVTYHGTNTTGADLVSTATLGRCGERGAAPCLRLHGRALFRTNDRVLATTGEGPLLELSLAGRRVREWSLGQPGNHLMEFGLSPDGRRAAAVGPCGYAGGLSIVDLAAGTVTVHRYPQTICADRVAFLDRDTVALARNRLPVPQGARARLDLVDLTTGRITARRPTPSEVVDLLAA